METTDLTGPVKFDIQALECNKIPMVISPVNNKQSSECKKDEYYSGLTKNRESIPAGWM